MYLLNNAGVTNVEVPSPVETVKNAAESVKNTAESIVKTVTE